MVVQGRTGYEENEGSFQDGLVGPRLRRFLGIQNLLSRDPFRRILWRKDSLFRRIPSEWHMFIFGGYSPASKMEKKNPLNFGSFRLFSEAMI